MDKEREGTGEDAKQLDGEIQSTLEGEGNGGGQENLSKGKSCKGYLYYSSSLKSSGRNPRCIGVPRTLSQAPNYVISQSEAEASREGRTLVDFYYACAGYSIYSSDNGANDSGRSKTGLPVCVGLELLVDRKSPGAVSPASASQTHNHGKEVAHDFPHRGTHTPTPHSLGDDFISRFTKNANLVASGVVKNLRKVGTRIKSTVDDFLYPFRRRPK